MRRIVLLFICLALSACERPQPQVTIVATPGTLLQPPTPFLTRYSIEAEETKPPTPPLQPTATIVLPSYEGTPTPDPPRPGEVSEEGDPYLAHTVGPGETLGYLAQQYGSTMKELMEINDIDESEWLSVGQVVLVPTGPGATTGPTFKIIPDSELVYGPAARDFDVATFAARYKGYLVSYRETVEGELLTGPEIVQLVANRFSVNPRLLLAALEYRSGWVTQSTPTEELYPLRYYQGTHVGLYDQLSWTADQLNWGYYGRSEGGVVSTYVGETRVGFAIGVNDGTAGVQHWLAAYGDVYYDNWIHEAGPDGFYATYNQLFGNPFAYTVDPLWPADLAPLEMALPWAEGETWYFTGGPHGGWASGSAWAALDFVSGEEQIGCAVAEYWVRAMAPGVVARSDFGAVVVDLDGDGYAGTGWAITYMHLAAEGRVKEGQTVNAGDPLGHESCEGGYSTATHVHISRTYNGRWVSADGPLPFIMDGWRSEGLGREYDGLLVRGEEEKEACECRLEMNAITRD